MKVVALCCSFAPLTFDYDYSGLTSFMKYVDYCVFFNSGISKETVELINNACVDKSVYWFDHSMTDFSNMRNRLIKCAIKVGNSMNNKEVYCFMIDDTYSISGESELIISDEVMFTYRIPDYYGGIYEAKYTKLFKAKTHHYVLQCHEVLIGPLNSEPVNCELIISDIPDKVRTTERAERDIKMLKEDLHEYLGDNFIRNHILRYIYNSYALLGKEIEANKYLDLWIIDNRFNVDY